MCDDEIIRDLVGICENILDILHPMYSSKADQGNMIEKDTRFKLNKIKAKLRKSEK